MHVCVCGYTHLYMFCACIYIYTHTHIFSDFVCNKYIKYLSQQTRFNLPAGGKPECEK